MIKEKDQLIKTEKHKKLKKYRNKVTDLLKTSKQAHYHNYFEENKKNCRALWIGITTFSILKTKIKQILPYFKMVKQSQIKNILLKISTISSQVLAKNYKKTSHLLKSIFRASERIQIIFFVQTFSVTPTAEEVNDLISDLKASKSIGPSSLPTKIMKWLNDL